MDDAKTLVKILIGVAWLDGCIQPEERLHIQRIAKDKGVDQDREIQPILYELRSVKPEECYQWVQDYLGEHPTAERCHQLLEAISQLIYADGTITHEEAKLLTRLQILESEPAPSLHTKIIAAICKLYQHGIAKIEKL
ncbi:TerB family tellurite resistance protein [Leptolyngbya sp. FACHB-17]|uniref:tellurite resistance TerB family protein n=1 Tax=unclassified Leptolyngbya TaxID=2650499 RepID=UPI001680E6B1|nr:TerB family tellurite resistance protein [Leptolyngbya sp. FACHB-17]MBD2082291.1 TerB family tellurite resistance protein [Leptolyngbya sp. FACHB-17]